MLKIFFISYLIINSFGALASEQEMYYHLHQAYTTLEMVSRGECETDLGKKMAKSFLISADKVLGKAILNKRPSQFEPSLHKLWSLWKSKELTAFEAESIRAEVQTLANEKGLIHHKKQWHQAINNKCQVFFRRGQKWQRAGR